MNRTKIRNYAPQARRDFIQAVTDRAALYGLSGGKIEPVTEKGDVAIIGGRAFPKAVAAKRKKLVERIEKAGFEQAMEAVAYTWFNRLVAIRYMELHGYLEHGYRVLSNADATKTSPEIVEHAEHVELPGLKREQVVELKLAGNKEAELYRLLLLAQCNALHSAMPFLFERIDDETELLFPENLLHSDSIIRKLASEIDEDDWQEVEIIGWLYESYIAERYEAVIGSVVASADIPAATQRFTPKWIVRYLVQNTLGRQWLATYPQSALKSQMRYYIEPAEQTPEVLEQLKAITPTSLNPEELTLLDPACGSGHILVEGYDLFKAIYLERGYNKREIPKHILAKNLFGLEIDDRAAQLAALALMMKARADDRKIFESGVQPHVLALQETKGLDAKDITDNLNAPVLTKELPPPDKLFEDENELFSKANMSVAGDLAQADIATLIDLFENTKTFGSLLQVPPKLAAKLPHIEERVRLVAKYGEGFTRIYAGDFLPFVEQAKLLAGQYDCVVANPPYMGVKGMNNIVKEFLKENYADERSDIGVAFIQRSTAFARQMGTLGLITMHGWMFLSGYDEFREKLLRQRTIDSMAHLGARAFSSISGEVVQVTAFSLRNHVVASYRPSFFRLTEGNESDKDNGLLGRLNCFCNGTQDDFASVPGHPLAYWAKCCHATLFSAFSAA